MKQKKWYYAALAALFLSACSNEAIDKAPQPSDAINFGVFTNRSSYLRAGVTNIDTLQESGFKVVAYKTDATAWANFTPTTDEQPLFMGSIDSNSNLTTQEVTHVSFAWTYAPVKYWPINGEKVSFFAYNDINDDDSGKFKVSMSPATNTQAATPTLSVTIPSIIADQKDLVAAKLIDQTSSSNTSNPGQVNFAFAHLLSKIGIQAKTSSDLSSDNITVTLTELKIKIKDDQIKTEGTYTFDPGTWTNLKTTISSHTKESLIEDGTTKTIATNGSPTQLNDDHLYLMLFPGQSIAVGDLTIDLTYTIKTSDDTTTEYKIEGYSLNAISSLAQNTQYNYVLTLGIAKVVFAGISVSGWETPATDVDQTL
jgi:hypothetical protein